MSTESEIPGSPTPTPQWTMANWMQAYQAAQVAAAQAAANRTTETTASIPTPPTATTPPPVSIVPPKNEPPSDTMMGGWRYEGKQKPVTPRTCTKCQWVKRNEQMEEPAREGWCSACLRGEVLGTEPEGYKAPVEKPEGDLNAAFFG